MLPAGHTLYEYRIEGVLGAGGFGITYLGRDTHLGRWYAIKEYLPRDTAVREAGVTVRPVSAAVQEDFTWGMNRFLAEAQTLAQFQHPNLVGVVRYFKANGTAYIVMDYVEGEVLASYIGREAPLSEAVLRGILAPVMDGLAQVHGAGYLHRDIKPDNIVLREDGSPVLLDFGAARLAMGVRSRRLTAVLTPGYAPIEQYSESSTQGPYTDIYALGAVLYYGLTGEAPQEASDRMLEDTLPVLAAAGYRGISQGFLAGIDAALKVYPRDRPISLESWRRMLDGPAPAQGAAVSGEPGPRRLEVQLNRLASRGVGGGRSRPVRRVESGRGSREAADKARAGEPEGDEASGAGGSVRAGGNKRRRFLVAMLVVVIASLVGYVVWIGGYGPGEYPSPSQPVVVPAPPVQDEARTDGEEVTRLLAAAEADITARRLTRPAGNNAWEKYQQVLSLSPAHPAAIVGMARVIGRYLALFDEAFAQGEFEQAAAYLERIRELNPDSPELADGERRLAAARQRQAEQERQRREAEAKARQYGRRDGLDTRRHVPHGGFEWRW